MNSPLPVAELLRVSTEGQADRLGLPAQRTANADTAQRFGLEIVDTVQIVMSGAEVATSEGMERLLSLVESGRARGVVVAQYDRLFRPERWSDMMVLQRLQDASAGIWTPSGEIDLSTERGHMEATLYNLFASMERRKIRQRLEAGKEEKRRQGHHAGHPKALPIGLTWAKGGPYGGGWSYTPEAAIVAEVFRRFLAGERNHVALGQAVGLGRTSIRYMLGNVVYTGWRVYDTRRDPSAKSGKGNRRRIPRLPGDVLRVRLRDADGVELPPLVSEEDFAVAQRHLEAGRLRSSHANARTEHNFVYRGTLFCGTHMDESDHGDLCGQPFYHAAGSRSQDGTYKRFYYCRSGNARFGPSCGGHYMSEHRLDPVLDAALASALTNPATLKRALAAHHDRAPVRSVAVPGVNTDALAARLADKRSRVLDAYVDGALTREERDARLAKIDAEIRSLSEITPAAPAPSVRAFAPADVLSVVRVFRRFHRLDFDAKRAVLETVRPRLFVSHYAVEGVWLDGRLFGGDLAGDGKTANRLKKADRVTTGARTAGGLYIPLAV